MQLVEAVGAALRDRYALGPRSLGREPKTPISQPKGLEIRMRRIMDKFKGNRKEAAAAAGVPYSTWNHLLAGRRVSKRNLAKITGAFAKLVTYPARKLRVKQVGLPDVWSIQAVVVCDPKRSRYVNGRGTTDTAPEDIEDIVTGPEWRVFNAEGLNSGLIVDAWLSQGDDAATAALLAEIEAVYGDEFGFEGDHVDVAFEHR